MSTKQELQIAGEDFVVNVLKFKGFTICSRNVRKIPFEFDIICSKGTRCFVVEVRTTSLLTSSVLDHFPITKLLTLIKGTRLHFPYATILCYLVRISHDTHTARRYYISDLL